MDEMQLIRELDNHSRLATAEELAPARAQLLAAAAAERAHQNSQVPRRRRFGTGTRLGLGGAIGIAAAVAAVVVIAPFGGQTPNAHAEAVQVLHNAADATRALSDVEPRPDQFVYTKSAMDTDSYESWMSVDGTRDSMIVRDGEQNVVPGCKDGERAVVGGNINERFPDREFAEPCEPQPAVDTSLSADADAIYALIEKQAGDDVNAMAKEVLYLIEKSHTRSEVRAAIFDAASRIPGLTMVENVQDAAGRTGVGISWSTDDGKSGMLVFDPESHIFLGSEGSAVLETKIVDDVPDLP
jgi:hypothetical protein